MDVRPLSMSACRVNFLFRGAVAVSKPKLASVVSDDSPS